jgi:hypothetical protein
LVDVTPKLCDECPNSGILACGISKLGKQFARMLKPWLFCHTWPRNRHDRLCNLSEYGNVAPPRFWGPRLFLRKCS